jgi:hypothetical protein
LYYKLNWFIFQRRLCILLHISEKIVYFTSYFRQDCVFCFIFQTILCILLHISDKIVYFPSYFRQDCVFSFIFQRRLCIFLHFQTRLCIFLHISDKIVYVPSYFRQDCVLSFIFQTILYIWCLSCRFQLRCWLYLLSLVYIWSSWKVSKISNHLPMYSVSICIYHHYTCEFETTLCDQVYQWLIPGTVSLTVYYRYILYNNLNLPPRCSSHIVKKQPLPCKSLPWLLYTWYTHFHDLCTAVHKYMIIIYHDKHLTVMQTVYRSCPCLSQTLENILCWTCFRYSWYSVCYTSQMHCKIK